MKPFPGPAVRRSGLYGKLTCKDLRGEPQDEAEPHRDRAGANLKSPGRKQCNSRRTLTPYAFHHQGARAPSMGVSAMQIRSPLQKYGSLSVFSMILWAPAIASDCMSATFADEVYYSCSGVLTVVPRDAGHDPNKHRLPDSSTPKTEPMGTGVAESTPEASPLPPDLERSGTWSD